jgi:hypothetical protein
LELHGSRDRERGAAASTPQLQALSRLQVHAFAVAAQDSGGQRSPSAHALYYGAQHAGMAALQGIVGCGEGTCMHGKARHQ